MKIHYSKYSWWKVAIRYPAVGVKLNAMLTLGSVYGSLVIQTRLQQYLAGIKLIIGNSGFGLDFSAMEAANDFEWRKKA